jgi:hypothetical protein
MGPVRTARTSLLRERFTLLKALHVRFRSGNNCSSCCKWDLPSQAFSHELVVSRARPWPRSSLNGERLACTIARPPLCISTCCDHHDGSDCDENGRSAHVSFSLGVLFNKRLDGYLTQTRKLQSSAQSLSICARLLVEYPNTAAKSCWSRELKIHLRQSPTFNRLPKIHSRFSCQRRRSISPEPHV